MSSSATHSICGRADLVRALAAGGPDLLNTVAKLLEFDAIPPQGVVVSLQGVSAAGLAGTIVTSDSEVARTDNTTVDVPFWRIETYRANEIDQPSRRTERKKKPPVSWQPPDLTPEPDPIASWSSVFPRLRRVATERTSSRDLDIDATVNCLGRGEWLKHLPQRQHLRWGQQLQVISDRSYRLIPFWKDQDQLVDHLQRYFPKRSSEEARYFQGRNELVIVNWQDESFDDYILPPAGTLIIAFSDLGSFARRPAALLQHWLTLGRQLTQAGCRPVALIPGILKRCPPELSRYWTLLPWYWPQQEIISDEEIERQIDHLLTLISPAIRIEPGFLRGVRRLLGTDYSDPALESEIWQHPALISKSSVAATLNPKTAQQLRQQFEQLPTELQKKVLDLLRRWRTRLPQEIWFEEIRDLGPSARNQLPDSTEIELQRQFFASLGQDGGENDSQLQWFARMNRRLSARAWEDPHGREGLNRLWHAIYGNDPNQPLPLGFDPADITDTNKTPKSYQITQQGNRLCFAPAENNELKGSPIGTINAGVKLLNLEQIQFWKSGTAPDWASSWGEDEYGPWVSFDIAAEDGRTVSQRMRWIPPGQFLMGSPENEEGRFENEGPQHEVTISHGYWMFDTPCTQALWEIVMGDNPSYFKDLQRPTGQVSWNDVQVFLERINKRLPKLELTLPNEAQWEYACRAGKSTSTYVGDLEILGYRNAPILDEIAWYGGNSGHEFDLEESYNSSGWKEKQYPHTRTGTRKVAQKKPNSSGLYDTLGNVWEWCLDGLRDYESEPICDPSGPSSRATVRVLRGGSCYADARFVRAAVRDVLSPSKRRVRLGFRAARVQVGAEPELEREAKPLEQPISRQPERLELDTPNGLAGGRQVHLEQIGSTLLLPKSGSFIIRSDCEQLGLGIVTKPHWAKSIGRDRFGLWVDIEVDTVIQRMRWISPGQFEMGSMLSEKGRLNSEGPMHNVILSKGYWLFDTPCTQALWQSIMERNPSEFQDPIRPVENISWLEIQEFLQQINQRIEGLELTLPTEAQWEYACRAGTTTATYVGDLEISRNFDAPLLEAIAWYDGNSSKDSIGTRQVAQKRPNQWGLYDMLGNVDEWCLDGERNYKTVSVIDPIGSLNESSARVVRGGSWSSDARYVRAARRLAYLPDLHDDGIGFRCTRV